MLNEFTEKKLRRLGFTEFTVMCEAKGHSAAPYWGEMLGEDFKYLKRRW
jgi:hypothetical protein